MEETNKNNHSDKLAVKLDTEELFENLIKGDLAFTEKKVSAQIAFESFYVSKVIDPGSCLLYLGNGEIYIGQTMQIVKADAWLFEEKVVFTSMEDRTKNNFVALWTADRIAKIRTSFDNTKLLAASESNVQTT